MIMRRRVKDILAPEPKDGQRTVKIFKEVVDHQKKCGLVATSWLLCSKIVAHGSHHGVKNYPLVVVVGIEVAENGEFVSRPLGTTEFHSSETNPERGYVYGGYVRDSERSPMVVVVTCLVSGIR
ncbi:hypothetical protein ACFX1X_047462 [Malus domestica]